MLLGERGADDGEMRERFVSPFVEHSPDRVGIFDRGIEGDSQLDAGVGGGWVDEDGEVQA